MIWFDFPLQWWSLTHSSQSGTRDQYHINYNSHIVDKQRACTVDKVGLSYFSHYNILSWKGFGSNVDFTF